MKKVTRYSIIDIGIIDKSHIKNLSFQTMQSQFQEKNTGDRIITNHLFCSVEDIMQPASQFV